jgi:predicted transcriptional regulator
MPRNRSWIKETAELGELELSLLLLVWRRGALTAEEIGRQFFGGANGASVRAALRLLEEHGLLAHSIENRAFIYRPIGARHRVTVRASQPPRIALPVRLQAG